MHSFYADNNAAFLICILHLLYIANHLYCYKIVCLSLENKIKKAGLYVNPASFSLYSYVTDRAN